MPRATTLRAEARALLAEIVGTARDPLMVAINIAADTDKPDAIRLEAALGACRFLHPTLSAAAVQHIPARPDTDALVSRIADRLARLPLPSVPAPAPVIDVAAEAVELATTPAERAGR